MKDYLLTVLVLVSNTLLSDTYANGPPHFQRRSENIMKKLQELGIVEWHQPVARKDVLPIYPSYRKIQADHKDSSVKKFVDELDQTKPIKADSNEELTKAIRLKLLWKMPKMDDEFIRWNISSTPKDSTIHPRPSRKTEEDKHSKPREKRSTTKMHESTENPRWKPFFENISKDSKHDSSKIVDELTLYVANGSLIPLDIFEPTKDDKREINTTKPTEDHKPEINITEPMEDHKQTFVSFNLTSSLEELNKFRDPKNFVTNKYLTNVSHISDTLLNERLKQLNVTFIDLVLPKGFNLNEFLEKEKFMEKDPCYDARREKAGMFHIARILEIDYSELINHAETCLQYLDLCIKSTINVKQKRIESQSIESNHEISIVSKLENMLNICFNRIRANNDYSGSSSNDIYE